MVKILIVLFLMYPWDCEDVMDLFEKLLTMRINLFWSLFSQWLSALVTYPRRRTTSEVGACCNAS